LRSDHSEKNLYAEIKEEIASMIPQVFLLLLPFLFFGGFSEPFLGFSIRHLIRRFEGISIQISLRGSWVSALCLFVDDLDPSNARFGLRSVDF
jgi:hypothetical protein